MAQRFDILVHGGTIVDGTGNPSRRGDIGVRKGKVAAIGNLAQSDADQTVDAAGRHICPGFVNIHSHLDFSILGSPEMAASVRQGITTELGGQCGASVAPTDGDGGGRISEQYRYFWNGYDLDWNWVRVRDFLERVEECGSAINFGIQVGHTNLRVLAMDGACRSATRQETKEMGRMLARCLRDGAFGLTSGLQWAPGFFADNAELVELGAVVGQHGGFYASHMRSEGDCLLEAVSEVIEVAEKARIPAVVSHLKASGKSNFGKVNGALRLVADARSRGVDVFVDTQPYGCPGHTRAAEHMMLRSCLPPWIVAETQGGANLRELMKDSEFRDRVRRELEERTSPEWRKRVMDNILAAVGWENLVLGRTEVEAYKDCEGQSIAGIAEARGEKPFDTYFDILANEDVPSGALFFMMDPNDVQTVVTHEFAMLEVDGSPRTRHPRIFGCFPRFLTDYVLQEGLMSLEQAVRKITSFPAAVMGLEDRGLLRPGFWADFVIFDWPGIEDRADFDHVDNHPSGISHVFVNGVAVVEDGAQTGARPGRALRNG